MEASAVPRLAPSGVPVLRSPQLLRLATDAHLVALVREGRGAAFEAVYDRHHRGILSFCRHMLGDPQEAEDAVQHTFLAAYNDLISSQKQIHLRAWLFTIARNRCYSILRSRREQPAAELDEAMTEGLATQVQRREDLRDLVVDMRQLPADQRAALVLAELESLSHEQIGEALGVPREKVKALVFQARESLVASRAARETDCAEIREQLATQRGGALRRANLRRHLRECAGCRDFRKQIERQRRQLAVLLPVAPTVALKEGVLATTVGSTATVGIAGGGLFVSSALKSGALKVIIGAVVAGMGTAGTIVATHGLHLLAPAAPAAQSAAVAPSAAGAGQPGAASGSAGTWAGQNPASAVTQASGEALPSSAGGTRGRSRTAGLVSGGVSFSSTSTLTAVTELGTTAVLGNHPPTGAAPVSRPPSAATNSPASTGSGAPSVTAGGQVTQGNGSGTSNSTSGSTSTRGQTGGSSNTTSASGTGTRPQHTPAGTHSGQDGGYGSTSGSSSGRHGGPSGSSRGQGGGNGPDPSGTGQGGATGSGATSPGATSGSGSSGSSGSSTTGTSDPSSGVSGSGGDSGSGGAGVGTGDGSTTPSPTSGDSSSGGAGTSAGAGDASGASGGDHSADTPSAPSDGVTGSPSDGSASSDTGSGSSTTDPGTAGASADTPTTGDPASAGSSTDPGASTASTAA